MSFVDKIKGWGQRGSAEHDAINATWRLPTTTRRPAPAAGLSPTNLPPADSQSASTFDTLPRRPSSRGAIGSIVSEAVPSRNPDSRDAPPGIGNRRRLARRRTASHRQAACAQQQRILIAMLGVGLFGLVVLTSWPRLGQPRLVAGRGERPGPDAVAAPGQVGVAGAGRQRQPAFAELKGERRCPRQQRAEPEDRRGRRSRAPSGVQDLLDKSCRWSTGPRRTPAPCWRSRRC